MSRARFGFFIFLFALFLFTFFRAVFYFSYFDYFSELSAKEIFFAFFNGARFDISIFLTFLAIPMLFIMAPIKNINKKWVLVWTYLIVVMIFFFSAILLGDIVYFNYVKRHLSNELLLLIDDFDFLVDMIVFQYPYFIAIFAVVLFFIHKAVFKIVEKIDLQKRSVALFLLIFVLFVIGVRGGFSQKSINVIDGFSSSNAKQGNLTLNGAFTAYHYSRKSGKFEAKKYYSHEEISEILDAQNRPNPEFLYEKTAAKNIDKKNIIFVLMESWSAKYVDAIKNGGYGVTPNFDALAKEGRLFVNFYATGQRSIEGIQATLTSIPSFTGLPSIGRGLEVFNISKVADIANQNGYETIFVQSSKRRSFRIDAIAESMGFKHYYGMEDMPILLDYEDKSASKFGWDYESYMFLKDRLNELKEPFFAYLFTGTTHVPYAKLPKKFLKYEHEENGINGFLNTLYYSDWALGEFMKEAKKSSWYENSVFIFTADHALGGESDNILKKFQIPLLIYIPNETGAVDKRVASHLDLMPTIVDFIGHSGHFSSYGNSLLKDNKTNALLCEANSIVLVKNEGFLRHSLSSVLETNLSNQDKELYEKELLANYQLINELLKKNKWAR